MTEERSIWIGWDPREAAAYAVARHSIKQHLTQPIPVRGLVLDDLRKRALYVRPTTRRLGRLYDVISEHEMATEFAISRFLVPHLAGSGWALFMDCDMLVRANLARLFDELDPQYAVYCVKHNHMPTSTEKMDGQRQAIYFRKNWSSFIVFNCDHPANQELTVKMVNETPGRHLHALCWLRDSQIGELDVKWNWLVGHSSGTDKPNVVHFSEGGPWFEAYKDVPYADEWVSALGSWAA